MTRRARRILPGEADRPARSAHAAAAIAGGLGALASALVIDRLASGDGFDPGPWLAVAALCAAPWLGSLHPARMRRLLGFEGPPRVVFLLAEVVGVVALGVHAPVAVVPAVLIALQMHLLAAFTRDASAAWAPVVSVGQAVTAVALAPGAATALLLPLVAAAAVAARVLVHARLARAIVARRARAETPRESGSGLTSRLAYALPLAALLVLAATAVYPLCASPPWTLGGGGGDAGSTGRRPAPEAAGASPASRAAPMSFSADIAMNGIPMPAYEVLMEVEPRVAGAPGGDLGALHLRGVVLSHMTAAGARMRTKSAPTRHLDRNDGEEDGWTRLRELPPASERMELVISQYPLPIEPQGWNLLFATYPLYAIDVPALRFDPDRLLLSDETPEDWFSYTVVVRRPGLARAGLTRAAARIDDARYLQLPPDSAPLRWLAAEARGIVRGAESDLERVRAFERHFARYEYSLEGTEFGGVDGVVEFMGRRSGFCTHYSSATVLMLRTLGIPARIASGFLVHEWDADAGIYRVRPRDTHAWVEVHFEGVGWVTFDPTPPDTRRAALASDVAHDGPGAGAWATDVLDRIGRWAASGGEAVSTREVLAAIASAPRAVAWVLASFVLSLAVILVVGALRRRGTRSRRTVSAVQREAEDVYGRLLAALRRHGYRKRPEQTPREFARAVAHAGGVSLRSVREITESFYAVRYGGRPLDPALRRRVDEFVARLAHGH